MRTVTLQRIKSESGPQGTFGKLSTGTFECYTGELPEPIPAGKYRSDFVESPRLKVKRYRLAGVPGHDGILLHGGNFCGDTKLGFKSDSEGCILLGNAIAELAGQKALLSSKDALARFESDLEGKPFDLVILEAA